MASRPIRCIRWRQGLEQCRHGVASTETHRRDAPSYATLLERVKKRHHDSGAAGTERVAECDGSAVDVDVLTSQSQLVPAGQHLDREGFVDLKQMDVVNRECGQRECATNRRDGRHEQVTGFSSRRRVTHQAGDRSQPMRLLE